MFLLFPETAGRSLEEVTHIFEDPEGIKYIGTPAWKTSVATKAMARAEGGDLESKLGGPEHTATEHTEKSPVTETA